MAIHQLQLAIGSYKVCIKPLGHTKVKYKWDNCCTSPNMGDMLELNQHPPQVEAWMSIMPTDQRETEICLIQESS